MAATDRETQRNQARLAATTALVGSSQDAAALVKARGGTYFMAIPLGLGVVQWPYAGLIGFLVVALGGAGIVELVARRLTRPLGIGVAGGFLSLGNGTVSVSRASFWTGKQAVRLLGQWPAADITLEVRPSGGRMSPAVLHLPDGVEVRLEVSRESLPSLTAITRAPGIAPPPDVTPPPIA